MNPRSVALEMLKSRISEDAARDLLDRYSDAVLEKKMAGKWQAVQFVDEMLRDERQEWLRDH